MYMIYTFRLKRNVFYIHELLFVQQRVIHNKLKFMYFYFRFLINASKKNKTNDYKNVSICQILWFYQNSLKNNSIGSHC